MNIFVNTVIVIKLSSGEEVIGAVNFIDDKELVLDDVLGLGYDLQNGQLNFGFIPYSPLTSKSKSFLINSIIFHTLPKDALLQAYKGATGGIVTPPQNIITA